MDVADDVDDVDAVKRSIILSIDTGINNLISQMDEGDRMLIQIDPGITLLNANYTPDAEQSPIKKVNRITDMNDKYIEIIGTIGEEHPLAAGELLRRMSVDTQTLNLDSIITMNNEIKGILDMINDTNLGILEDFFDEVEVIMTAINNQLDQLLLNVRQVYGGYGTPRKRNRASRPPPYPRKGGIGGSRKRKSKKRKSKKRKSKKRKSKKRKSKKK
jgi:hypothetical protein